MTGIEPTNGATASAKNVSTYIKENKPYYWAIFKPLLSWVLGLAIFDLVVNLVFFPNTQGFFALGGLIGNYFYAALAISWHRVVIYGGEKAVPMNPFKPKKHELIFMVMSIVLALAIGIISVITIALISFIFMAIHPVLGVLSTVGIIFIFLYITYRFSFYFPAKAIDKSISLKDAFKLTKGYFLKMTGALFLANLKYFIALAIFYIVTIFILNSTMALKSEPVFDGFLSNSIGFIFSLPIIIYFYPILTIVGVSVLSNFYLYVLQNKQSPASDDQS